MNDVELKDTEVLKAAVAKLRVDAYLYLRTLVGLSQTDLNRAGYQSLEQALKLTITDTDAKIKRLMDAHVAKYPD